MVFLFLGLCTPASWVGGVGVGSVLRVPEVVMMAYLLVSLFCKLNATPTAQAKTLIVGNRICRGGEFTHQ